MWTEYPEIAPTFRNVYVRSLLTAYSWSTSLGLLTTTTNSGVPPNKEGTPYTIPVLRFPRSPTSEPRWVMESRAIAAALEQEFPSPPLHLDAAILPKVEALVSKISPALAPIFVPRVARDILNPRSISYFVRTRKEKFGMPLDELEKSEKGGEAAWKNAGPHLSELAVLLKENDGPFFLGEAVSYADFVVVGLFQFLKRISYDNDAFDRAMQTDSSFLVLYDACAQWLKRDDY